jgi:hypothetical protein
MSGKQHLLSAGYIDDQEQYDTPYFHPAEIVERKATPDPERIYPCISYADVKIKYNKETGEDWINSQGEPDVDYVQWLEDHYLENQ